MLEIRASGFADYVNVIEFEWRIAHHLPSRRDCRRPDYATILLAEHSTVALRYGVSNMLR
jgi:hypothetical protein